MKTNLIHRTYVNKNIFLVEILGMTNYCNLRCEYCDWEKKKYVQFTDMETLNVKRNLENTRLFIKTHFPKAQMIEYSGGEPFIYPEVVMQLLDIFPDYWVRVITNGILVKEEHIDKLQAHGKAFLAISLDGHTISANHSRGITVKQLKKIFWTIDRCMKRGVPVMILCTLNEDNTDEFFSYIDFLYRKWGTYIESGLLVLPAHVVSSYENIHRSASVHQREEFKHSIQNSNNPLITKIQKHYDEIFSTDIRQCTVYKWSASMHFIDREIAGNGIFTCFRCGMRGVGKIGCFNVNDELTRDTYSNVMTKAMKKNFASFECNCTVDWDVTDKILSGVIDLKTGESWFKPFEDENIQKWVKSHMKNFKVAYTRGGDLKKPILCKRIT